MFIYIPLSFFNIFVILVAYASKNNKNVEKKKKKNSKKIQVANLHRFHKMLSCVAPKNRIYFEKKSKKIETNRKKTQKNTKKWNKIEKTQKTSISNAPTTLLPSELQSWFRFSSFRHSKYSCRWQNSVQITSELHFHCAQAPRSSPLTLTRHIKCLPYLLCPPFSMHLQHFFRQNYSHDSSFLHFASIPSIHVSWQNSVQITSELHFHCAPYILGDTYVEM